MNQYLPTDQNPVFVWTHRAKWPSYLGSSARELCWCRRGRLMQRSDTWPWLEEKTPTKTKSFSQTDFFFFTHQSQSGLLKRPYGPERSQSESLRWAKPSGRQGRCRTPRPSRKWPSAASSTPECGTAGGSEPKTRPGSEPEPWSGTPASRTEEGKNQQGMEQIIIRRSSDQKYQILLLKV